MKRFTAILLVVFLVVATMAGCGGGGQQESAAADPASTEPAASDDAQEAASEPEAAGNPDAEYKVIAATSNTPTHPYYLGLLELARLLDEKSGGRIALDVFHSAQLGSERDIVEGLQLDTIQFASITSAPLSGFTDAYAIFDLPFLFADVTEARMVCDSEFGQTLLSSMEDDGVVGLSFFENGMRSITNSKRPIEQPEDLQGIKIRTMENPMHMEAFRVMGADPTPMAFGELFTALQQKAIDAEENPFVVIHSSKFNEVQEFLSITEHLYSPAPLLASKTFYDSLPEDLQQVVQEAAIEAADFQRAKCDELSEQLLKELEESGMKVNTVDKAPFVEATQSVYDKYVGDMVSQEAYDQVKALLGK